MIKFYKILFFNSLIISSLIAVSAYSWLNMWIGLEINLLSFIPLLKSSTNIYPAEASIKYFLVQIMASTILLFSIMMQLNWMNMILNDSNFWLNLMLNSSLLMKLGAAPFHFWFPEVIEGLNWLNSLLLLTWQKLAPMVLIMYNLNMTKFLSIIIIISSLIGGILGMNQTKLRKIMAYSSINHIAWMLASLFSMKMIWLLYFLVYSLISFNIIIIFHFFKFYNIIQLYLNFNNNKFLNYFFFLNFLSLGGLPPFLGFLPKWLVINELINMNFYSISLILIISTLITLYFYIRITIPALSMLNQEMPIKIKISFNFSLILSNVMILWSLLFIPGLLNFL